MHLEDSFTPGTIWMGYSDMAVEATGTQYGFIQDINTVCRGQYHNGFATIKAVKFDQQLIEGLITLVIARDAHRTLTPHCVNFIDEDDTGCRLTSLIEEVAHPAGTDTDKHLNKL